MTTMLLLLTSSAGWKLALCRLRHTSRSTTGEEGWDPGPTTVDHLGRVYSDRPSRLEIHRHRLMKFGLPGPLNKPVGQRERNACKIVVLANEAECDHRKSYARGKGKLIG